MRRLLAIPLLIAALVGGAAPAQAAASPSVTAHWARLGSTVTVTVIGRSPQTGSWRMDLAGTGPAANEMLRITVTASDLGFTASFDELTRVGRSWVVRLHVDGSRMVRSRTATTGIFDSILGLSVDSGSLRLPANGNRTLTIQLRGPSPATHLALTGAVRIASPGPFQYGPWLATAPAGI